MFRATIAEVARYRGMWTMIQQIKVHAYRYRRHDPAAARTAVEIHLEGLLPETSAIQSQNINSEFFET